MHVDKDHWSGDGNFTERLLQVLQEVPEVIALRVEDAPSSHADAGYLFLSNEIYVGFATRTHREAGRWFGVIPRARHVQRPALTLQELEQRLTDDGMLQYLRAERIIPPYQTRGYKLVELVRIYEASKGVSHGASGSA